MFPTSLIRRHFQSHQETSNALQSELPRGERISVPSCPTSKNMSTSLLLQALKSPYPANIDLINIHEMRSLVLWLENTKIRHYSLEARAPLENQADEEWKEAFQKYLEDLDCPLAWDESMTHIVHWLLRYAGEDDDVDRRVERINCRKKDGRVIEPPGRPRGNER